MVQAADPGTPAFWFLVVFGVALVAFEIWALWTGHYTVSQYLQHLFDGHPMLAWITFGVLVLVAWHLVFGFPWKFPKFWRKRR